MERISSKTPPVPYCTDQRLVSCLKKSPLGFAGFATTLMTLSLSMIGTRGVENEGMFVADLLLLAGLGLIITAQWEMVRGNTFPYTVLSAFGFYYAGYGIMLLPPLGIIESYGGRTSEYYNAFGLYLAVWSCLNFIFFLASLSTNVANIIVYGTLEFSYILNSAAKFTMADGDFPTGRILTRTAGAFGAISAFSGFYLLYQGLCEQISPVSVPLGDIHWFGPRIITKRHTRAQVK